MDRGLLIRDGEPDTILDYYNAIIAKQEADQQIREVESDARKSVIRSGSRAAVIEFVDMLDARHSVRAVRVGDLARFRLEVAIREDLAELTVGLLIRDRLGNDVFGTNTWHLGASRRDMTAGERVRVEFEFPALNLGIGNYSVSFALHSGDNHLANNYDWWNQALVFQVIPGSGPLALGVSYLSVSSHWD
ncbi:MAG: Wzt carbohydrate-binding domain-containing protein [Candidatus Competibacteraceae bacterium]|nr:Wzt carbohydrate-binding domain-containing protein [Candidatus Competibacteraceae bacterium]